MARKTPARPGAIVNKRARFDYHLFDRFEAGIALKGTEVKSLRAGQADLSDAFARIDDGQVLLVGCQIQPYSHGTHANHDPKRARLLLLHRREIRRLAGKVTLRGFTVVPISIYFDKNGRAKVELALARGKTKADKRQDLRARDDRREMERAMRRGRG